MAHEPIDYEAVLADLQAKRATIDLAISAVTQLVQAGAQVAVGGAALAGAGKPVDPGSIPDDAFFGLSIGEAAKKYLLMVKRKQSVKEIADALDRGGLPHTSSNFVNTVGTMINRAAANDPELVRVGRGEWGLAAWYGNRRPKPEAPKKAKRPKRPERKASASERHAVKVVAKGAPASALPTVRDLAEKTLREAGAPLPLSEIMRRIADATGRQVKRDTLAGIFSVASRDKDTFFKAAPGVFGLIGQQPQDTLH